MIDAAVVVFTVCTDDSPKRRALRPIQQREDSPLLEPEKVGIL